MTLVRLACVCCLLAATGLSSAAPHDEAPAGVQRQKQLEAEILAEELDRETRVVGLVRARVSHPQRISAGFGAVVVRQPRSYECNAVCEFRGLTFQVEPGVAGGQLSLGYAVVMGEKGPSRHVLSHIYLAYGVRGALLRTWGNANLTPEDQTLLGVEGSFTVIRTNFTLGAFRRVGPGDSGDDWRIAGGLGWGF